MKEAPKNQHFLYLMVDPITDEVRYVGQSKDPQKRMYAHYSGPSFSLRSPKNKWIHELNLQGLRPKFLVVCSIFCTQQVIDYYEYRLILRFKTEHLFNERPFAKEKLPEPVCLSY